MKILKTVLLISIGLSVLTGCEPRKQDPVVSAVDKKYAIVDINPPKHFYVDIQDVETKEIYKNQYVSKHCNAYQKLKIGSVWNFQEVTYKGEKGNYKVIEGVAYKLCEKLQG
jgi:hypothetical protein